MLTPANTAVFQGQSAPRNGPLSLGERFSQRVQSIPTWCRQTIIFLISFSILVSRRPDAVFRPQFWAEDGWLFYAQSYNAGIFHPLIWTYGGYLHTFPRVIAGLAQLLPLALAPLFFNVVALTLQVMPVQMLLSSRLLEMGSMAARLSLAILYLCLPNSAEIHANLTAAHWRLAILAFLVIVSSSPRSTAAKIFDFLVVLVSSLTGPFAIMLTPVGFLVWRRRREHWKFILASTMAVCAGIQGLLILTAGRSQRMTVALGANLASFNEIMANHVFMGPLIGRNFLFHARPIGALVAAALGTAILLYGLIRGPEELRLFILFAGLLLAGSLASPNPWPLGSGVPLGPGLPAWQTLASGGVQRYWYMPMLAFVGTLLWLLKPGTPGVLHLAAILCFVLMSFGVVQDWRYPPPVDLKFGEYTEKFKQAPHGAVMVIPINPPGWSMRLVKH